ncbi:MAG: DUF1566 domain-containing protein [Candidatus Binatia bacterium]
MTTTKIVAAVAALLSFAGGAGAATDAQKCRAGKLKEAGKYGFCRLKADAKAVQTGDPPDYSKCDGKLTSKWPGIESKAEGMCPTNGDLGAQLGALTRNANRTAWELSGQPRFADTANGAMTDNQTGLQWEKKVRLDGTTDFANVHDADNDYPWSGTCSLNGSKYCQPTAAASALCFANAEGGTTGCDQCSGGDGTCNAAATAWTVAAELNTTNFAGHNDWRVPTLQELQGIIDYADATPPAVNAAFQGASCGGACTDITNAACECTQPGLHWSATTYASDPRRAAYSNFFDGYPASIYRNYNSYVRFVRSGS